MASSFEIFSPLTPLERGEVTQASCTCARNMIKIAMVCLSALFIVGGVLALSGVMNLSYAFVLGVILVGVALFLLSGVLCFFECCRVPRVAVAEDPLIEELQEQLRMLLEKTRIKALQELGFDREVDIENFIREKELQLGKFDRELRCRELGLYRKLTESTGRGEILFKLVEFREMQSRVAEELERLYRVYEGPIFAEGADKEEEIAKLQQSRDLYLQELRSCKERRKELSGELCEIHRRYGISSKQLQRIHQELKGAEGFCEETRRQVDTLIREQGILLQKVERINDELLGIDRNEEKTRKSLREIHKRLRDLEEEFSEKWVLYREYKEKYTSLLEKVAKLKIKKAEQKQKVRVIEGVMEENKKALEAAIIRKGTLEKLLYSKMNNLRKKLEDQSIEKGGLQDALQEFQQQVLGLQKELEKNKEFQEETVKIKENYENVCMQKSSLEKDLAELKCDFLSLQQKNQALEKEIQVLQEKLSEVSSSHSATIEQLTEELNSTTFALQALQTVFNHTEADLAASLENAQHLEQQIVLLKKELLSLDGELESTSQVAKDAEALLLQYEQVLESHFPQIEENHSLLLEIERLEKENLAFSNVNEDLQKKLDSMKKALEQKEKERLLAQKELTALQEKYKKACDGWKIEKEKLEKNREGYEKESQRLREEVRNLEKLLRESQETAASSHSEALLCAGEHIVRYSPYIKRECKAEILSGDAMKILAYASPRFFGALGCQVSCGFLLPGVCIEEEAEKETSQQQKEEKLNFLYMRTFLLSLLGAMSLDEVVSLSQKVEEEIKKHPSGFDCREIFEGFYKDNARLAKAVLCATRWLQNAHPGVPCTNKDKYYPTLLSCMRRFHFHEGGCFHQLKEEEVEFLKTVSCFSGAVPLALGGVGSVDGSSRPLGCLDYTHCGNLDWEALVEMVQALTLERSFTTFSYPVHAEEILQAREMGIEAYVAHCRKKYPRKEPKES